MEELELSRGRGAGKWYSHLGKWFLGFLHGQTNTDHVIRHSVPRYLPRKKTYRSLQRLERKGAYNSSELEMTQVPTTV